VPVHVIQPTFAGGEFAPSLRSRTDLARYPTGLARARNCIIHPHGGCSNRPGMVMIAETKDSSKRSKLFSFQFSTDQAYTLEFGDGYIRFYTDGAQIVKSAATAWAGATPYIVGDFVTESATTYYCLVAHTSGTFAIDLAAGKWVAQSIYEIPSDYAEADVAGLQIKVAQSADVLYIAHPDYPPMELARNGHDDWTLSEFDFSGGPFMLSNTDETNTVSVASAAWVTATAYVVGDYVESSDNTYLCISAHTSGVFATDLAAGRWYKTIAVAVGTMTMTAIADTFNAQHVGALWRYINKVTNTNVVGSLTTDKTDVILCGPTWRLITTGTWSGSVVIEKSTDAGTTWVPVQTFTSNVDTYGDTGESQCLIRLNRPTAGGYYPLGGGGTPTQSGTAVCNLSADPFDWVSIVRITAYSTAKIVTVTAEDQAISAQATFDWAEGSWSEYRGYPSVVTLHQDRTIWSSTASEPQTNWASETGNYSSFARSSPLVDSDGITVPLPSQKINAIRNLVPLGDLLALTSGADWVITSSNGVLTPATVQARPQGVRGSSHLAPVVVGNRIIAMQPMGQVVRDLGINPYDSSSTQGDDNISIMSAHLFQGFEIVGMAYAQEPDSLIWMVRDDGVLLCLTYLREQEVLAWTRHDTLGLVESICTIPGDGYDEVWLIVKRVIGGVVKRFVERMAQRMASTAPADQVFMDCAITYEGSPTDEVTGLDHLEGEDVIILADGKVVTGKTVTGGAVTLPFSASTVHVGIRYSMEMETLALELPLRDGTMQGRKARISEVTVRYEKSMGGKYGPADESRLDRIITRPEGIAAGQPVPLQDGEARLPFQGGWEDGARVLIVQEDPLPLTIVALIPRVEPGG
jgi:hypothetical protein